MLQPRLGANISAQEYNFNLVHFKLSALELRSNCNFLNLNSNENAGVNIGLNNN